VLVLDVWAVHKSQEFRMWLRNTYPHIQLVFVPANCTSQLQVADVVLQRPFKHGIRQRFNEWAADTLRQQVQSGELVGLNPFLKMSSIKPLLLQWIVHTWRKMKEGREYIKTGWHTCCVSLFDVYDPVKRAQVVEIVAKGELEAKGFVPEGKEEKEEENEEESEHEEDEEKDVLDVMKERQYGTRKSTRKRTQPTLHGYRLSSAQMSFCSSDSD
jgi:DNA segregation ATPase FtsK/SpoIIIE-like protein